MNDADLPERGKPKLEPPLELDQAALQILDRERENTLAILKQDLENAQREYEVAKGIADEMTQRCEREGLPVPTPIFTVGELVRLKQRAKTMCRVEVLQHIQNYELEVVLYHSASILRAIRRKVRDEVDAWLEAYRRLVELDNEIQHRNKLGILVRDDDGSGAVYLCPAHFDPDHQDALDSPCLFEPEEFEALRSYVNAEVEAYIDRCRDEAARGFEYAKAAHEATERFRRLYSAGATICADFKGTALERRRQQVAKLFLRDDEKAQLEPLLGKGRLW